MSGDMDGNDSDGSTATEDGPDTARSGALDVADEPTATDQPWIDDPAPFPTADDDDGEDDWPPRPPPPSTVQRRSEEHTSELQSLMRTSYAVFCLKKKQHN